MFSAISNLLFGAEKSPPTETPVEYNEREDDEWMLIDVSDDKENIPESTSIFGADLEENVPENTSICGVDLNDFSHSDHDTDSSDNDDSSSNSCNSDDDSDSSNNNSVDETVESVPCPPSHPSSIGGKYSKLSSIYGSRYPLRLVNLPCTSRWVYVFDDPNEDPVVSAHREALLDSICNFRQFQSLGTVLASQRTLYVWSRAITRLRGRALEDLTAAWGYTNPIEVFLKIKEMLDCRLKVNEPQVNYCDVKQAEEIIHRRRVPLEQKAVIKLTKKEYMQQIHELVPTQQAKEYQAKKFIHKSQLNRRNRVCMYESSNKNRHRRDLWQHHSGANNNRKCY